MPVTPPNLDDLLSEAIATSGPDLSERIESDPEAYLELVVRTDQAYRRTSDMLRAAVLAARGAGHSWEVIGTSLGMSRQAAQQRFGKGSSRADEDEGPEQRKILGLTAFNEMAVLEKAGRYGWHSVEYGPYFHLLERDDVQWEHRRVYAWAHNRSSLEADGWQLVGQGWFPWAYYARPIGIPAVEGDISYQDLLGL